jgi:hypothetical protein
MKTILTISFKLKRIIFLTISFVYYWQMFDLVYLTLGVF